MQCRWREIIIEQANDLNDELILMKIVVPISAKKIASRALESQI